jgi:hypothetical protein
VISDISQFQDTVIFRRIKSSGEGNKRSESDICGSKPNSCPYVRDAFNTVLLNYLLLWVYSVIVQGRAKKVD